MHLTTSKKTKICLADYDFQKDIRNRLLMAQLTAFDLEVLQEILSSSLTVPLSSLIDYLDCSASDLDLSLEKLSQSGLFFREGDKLIVDKETRKYFDFHAEKFESRFKPDMEYFQGLLHQVPIHVLPTWYAIPRTSDSIFQSIIEKFLFTPKVYREYLNELQYEDSTLEEMIQDIHQSPNQEIRSDVLAEKYGLSTEQLAETLIYLEYSLVASASYRLEGDRYVEVVTPFHEWQQYLRFLEETSRSNIEDEANIEPVQSGDFAFVRDMTLLLETFQNTEITEEELNGDSNALSKNLEKGVAAFHILQQKTFQKIIQTLFALRFIEIIDGIVHPSESAEHWLSMVLEDKAIFLYRHHSSSTGDRYQLSAADRYIRRIERGLRRVLNQGWVLFDDFMKGFSEAVGSAEKISLQQEGRQWSYKLPEYSESDRAFIRTVVMERFFEVGFIELGNYEGQDCFRLSTFGMLALQD